MENKTKTRLLSTILAVGVIAGGVMGFSFEKQNKELENEVEKIKQHQIHLQEQNSNLKVELEDKTKALKDKEGVIKKKDSKVEELEKKVQEEKKRVKKEQEKLKQREQELKDALSKKEEKRKQQLALANESKKVKSNQVAEQNTVKKSEPVTVSRSSGEPSGGREFYVSATAYTPHCAGCSGITATGINVAANPNMKLIAVDPSVIPLGSRVWVEGYGYAIAADTGGAIKGNKIDLLMPNNDKAYAWGRRTVKIKVLGK